MKCYIKRCKINSDGEKSFAGYFAKHLGLGMCQNHWVQLRHEAMLFKDGRKAQGIIKKYKLKDCEVEYDKSRIFI